MNREQAAADSTPSSRPAAIPAWSLRNQVFTHLLFFLCAVAGLIVFSGTIVDVYPDVSFDVGQILVLWPGASPEEVEASVTRKIEEEILDLNGVDRVVSSSERDRALIDVKFREDQSEAEFRRNFEDLRSEISQIRDLPAEAETPTVRAISVNEIYPMVQVAVVARGEVPFIQLRAVARDLRRHLQRVDGVLRVSDYAIPDREWKVRVRRSAMDAAGLDLLTLSDTIAARHLNLPAGTLEAGSDEIAVNASGEFSSLSELRDMVVRHPPGASPIRLGDVAEIVPGFERTRYRSRYNGQPAVAMGVAKRTDADAITVKRRIDAALDAFRESRQLPAGIDLVIPMDTTRIIKNRLRILAENLGAGVVLVLLILWLFLGIRNSVLALIGIPFSFLLAFLVLAPMGVTINAISLFSLVLISGMVVDDAVVVLENIYRHLETGMPLRSAIINGAGEVCWPVVASTLTTVAAFLPMLLMAGMVGEFMSIIPKTVIAVLVASLFECLIILPVHYLHFGSRRAASRPLAARWGRAMDALTRAYLASLRVALRRPSVVIAAVILLTAVAVVVGTGLPVELFPSDFQAFYANISLDGSCGLEQTSEAVAAFEALLLPLVPEVAESFSTNIGSTLDDDAQLILKPNVAQVLIYVPEGGEADPADVVRRVRELAAPLLSDDSPYPFTRINIDTFKDGPPTGKPVAVRVNCPDYDTGKAVARRIQDALRSRPGVHSISDNLEEGPLEFRVTPDPIRASRAGVPFASVARLVRTANDGWEVGDLIDPGGDEEITLRVLLHPDDRRDPRDLLLLRLPTAGSRTLPLSDLARIETRRGLASRYHYDGDRAVLVTADVDTAVTDGESVNQFLIERFRDIGTEFPGLTLEFGGEFEETRKSFASLRQAALIAVLLIFTILAASFRSYLMPAVVMVVVPFSFVGVVLGLWILGFPFTIMGFIAIVGLAGVVVNDSLVLVDFIRRYHIASGDALEAVVRGCQTRMRPVIITTVTTVFGLLPMALGLTGYSKVWSPFAATITFGLSLAMLLTLYLVPAVYVLLTRLAPRAMNPGADTPGTT